MNTQQKNIDRMATGWMGDAACANRADLPWPADADQVSAWDRLTMTTVCEGCPVLHACATFVATHEVTGGFWAGRPRDHPAAIRDGVLAAPVWAVEQPPLPGLGDAA